MNLGEAARRAADAVDPDRVAALAQALVRARSVVEPEQDGTEQEAAQVVVEALREGGLEPIVEEVAPGRPNVVCDWTGSTFDPSVHRTLLFEGHSDVVTEGDASQWTVPPFEGRIEDGVLYGRGSADMKAGVAAAIAAIEALRRAAPELPGRVRLGVVVDEESMMLGIKHFIERGWADDVSGAIVCEPEENEICLFQKGAMRLHVRVRGVMSHGAMPYAGINPILGLTDFVTGVREIERSEQQRLGGHPYLGLPWLTPTIVSAPPSGEAQHNVMPEAAYLALDVRTVPGQDHDDLLARLKRLGRTVEQATPGLKVAVECFESRPWTETPTDDPLVRAVERAYPAVLGRAPRYGGVPGATDGTFLRAWRGVPIVTLGPGDRTIPHQVDEFVRLPDVVDAARLYAAAAVEYFGLDTSKQPVGVDG
ncbi:MAG: M20 family metallopeptidase [Deinococcales bacterium]